MMVLTHHTLWHCAVHEIVIGGEWDGALFFLFLWKLIVSKINKHFKIFVILFITDVVRCKFHYSSKRLLLNFCNCASNTVFMKELCLFSFFCDETLSGRSWEIGRSTTVIQLNDRFAHSSSHGLLSVDACFAFIFAWYPPSPMLPSRSVQ